MSHPYTMVLMISVHDSAPVISYVGFDTLEACQKAMINARDNGSRFQQVCCREVFMIENAKEIQITPQVSNN